MSNQIRNIVYGVIVVLFMGWGYLAGYAGGVRNGAEAERDKIILKCEHYGVYLTDDLLMQCKVQRPTGIGQNA